MIRARTDTVFSSTRERGAKRNSKASIGQQCSIILLDGRDVQLEINKKTTGQWIFDYVIDFLKIDKKDYFGILYEDEHNCQQWLELSKPVKKQTKRNVTQLHFSIRYYPIDPLDENPIIRAQVYWQVKRDFIDGRLPCTPTSATQLCGYIAQAELCDWLEPRQEYLATLGLFNVEFQRIEDDIIERHKEFKGMTPLEAMTTFLDISSRIDFYGMVFFEVKYEEKLPHVLGISPHGLALCKEFVVVQSYPWNRIIQVSYKGKKFTIKVHSNWASNSKPSSVHFDVDSTRTCKELYDTFVEYINFYKDLDKNKPQLKGPTQIQLPSSISTDMLSQMLLKSIENEEERREKERHDRLGLHRSLSLPRNSKHQLSPLHPLSTAQILPSNTANIPLNKTLRQRSLDTTSTSSSHGKDLSSDLRRESEANSSGSRDSMHDSLLDLADDLGSEEVNLKHTRSNSNPEIVYHSASISTSQSCEELELKSHDSHETGGDPLLNQRKKNRLLLQNWVKEQKKKNLTTESSNENNSQSQVNNASTNNTYKLGRVKGNRTQSTSPDSSVVSYPYYRPNSATASTSYQIEDLYSIPRPSPAPSPGYFRRPHPFSTSSRSDLLVPSRGSSHNDYDIPRSLIDLRNATTTGISSSRAPSAVTTARSESSLLTGNGSSSNGGNHAPPSHQASLSSISAVDQISCLRDEYPDYDVPRRQSSKDYPDYDIPKPHSSKVSTASGLEEEREGGGRGGRLELSFGVLDSVMAEIDDHVAASQKTYSSLPSLIDRNSEPSHSPSLTSQHIRENSTPAVVHCNTISTSQKAASNPDPAYDHLAAKIALRQLIADGIIQPPNEERHHEKESNNNDMLTEEKESSEQVSNVLSKEMSIEEKVSPVKCIDNGTQPPSHLIDLTKNLKFDPSSNNNPVLPNLPFDPNFYARQTALEREKQTPTQLPPDVAKFMSWVKTGSLSPTAHNASSNNISLNKSLPNVSSSVQPNASPPLPQKMRSPTQQRKVLSSSQQKSSSPTQNKSSSPVQNKSSSPVQNKTMPTQNNSNSPIQNKRSSPVQNKNSSPIQNKRNSPIQNIASKPTQATGREPIYHEITEGQQQSLPPPPPPPSLALLPSNNSIDENDRPKLIVTPELEEKEERRGEGGKENKVSPTLQLKKDKSPVQNALLSSVANELPQFSGKRWHSFNIRRPLQIKLESTHSQKAQGEESIPSSPSFYTAHPLAGTMPASSNDTSPQVKQGFKEHLNEIGANSSPIHHHHVVSNWVKGTQKVKDTKTPSKSVQDQSVQSRLGQLPPIKSNDPSAFKDHLYEDPDVLLKTSLLQRKATEPVFTNTPHQQQQIHSYTMRNRSQSHVATLQRRPYVTREHKSSTGTTVYATDV